MTRSPSAPPALDAVLAHALRQASRHARSGALILIGPERAAELAQALPETQAATLPMRLAEHLGRTLATLHGGSRATLLPCGDEIAVILPVLMRTEDAETMADALLAALDQPVTLGTCQLRVGGHAGIGLFPNDGDHSAPLLARTRLALHAAQRQPGPERWAWSIGLHERTQRRLHLETALRQALARSAFALRFEPQADLGTGALTGLAARLHWEDGDLVAVHPAEWQDAAEAGRLTAELTRWTLGQACHQIRLWRSQGLEVPRLSVAVPAMPWRQDGFAPAVLHALVDHGLPGGVLTLAIDGTTLGAGPVEPQRQRIATLRSAGVHLGVITAGHDSLPLDRLARLPFDELYLDRSWLVPLDAGRLRALDWLTGLARSLNLRVLADGVETEAQTDVLRRHHCDEIQGRLLSPPLDAESTGQLLAHARVQQRLVMEARTLALPMSTTRGSVSRTTRRLTATG